MWQDAGCRRSMLQEKQLYTINTKKISSIRNPSTGKIIVLADGWCSLSSVDGSTQCVVLAKQSRSLLSSIQKGCHMFPWADKWYWKLQDYTFQKLSSSHTDWCIYITYTILPILSSRAWKFTHAHKNFENNNLHCIRHMYWGWCSCYSASYWLSILTDWAVNLFDL